MESNTPYNHDEFNDIRRYIEDRMSHEERHAFESKLLEDPFLADAVEGYSELPDWNTAPDIAAEISGSKGSSGIWVYFAISSLVVVLAVWMMLPSSESKSSELNDAEAKVANQESTIENEDNIAQEKEEEKAEIVEVSQTDSSVSMIMQSAPTAPQQLEEHFLAVRKIDAPEKMEPISGADSDIKIEQPAPNAQPKNRSLSGGKIYHVRDYKVADYRGLRFGFEKKPELEMGTPANDGIMPIEQNIPIQREIPYVDFIEEAMIAFASEDYKSALEDFRIVLQKYPEDVNTQFYGGMSARELGLYAMALQLLEAAEKNTINTFHDEAQYYKALSFKETGRQQEFESQMELIANSKSFYSEQAKNWLK